MYEIEKAEDRGAYLMCPPARQPTENRRIETAKRKQKRQEQIKVGKRARKGKKEVWVSHIPNPDARTLSRICTGMS